MPADATNTELLASRIQSAVQDLKATLRHRRGAERAVFEAERQLRCCQEALHLILTREGRLRGVICELEKLGRALSATEQVVRGRR